MRERVTPAVLGKLLPQGIVLEQSANRRGQVRGISRLGHETALAINYGIAYSRKIRSNDGTSATHCLNRDQPESFLVAGCSDDGRHNRDRCRAQIIWYINVEDSADKLDTVTHAELARARFQRLTQRTVTDNPQPQVRVLRGEYRHSIYKVFDAFLFNQGPTRGLAKIRFHDFNIAYNSLSLPNIEIFKEQIRFILQKEILVLIGMHR